VIDAASAPLPLILIKADPPHVEESAALRFAGRYRIATRMHALTTVRSWHATGCLPIERVAVMSENSAQRHPRRSRAWKGDKTVIEFLNKALRHELTAVNQ
jgi:hypothetical protein